MIKNNLLLIFCLIYFISANTQENHSSFKAKVLRHTYFFNLENESEATRILEDSFKKSDFILLGETHNSKRISEWVNFWIPNWKSNNYKHFVAEIGPYSAKKLGSIFSSKNSLQNYNSFLKEYSMPYEFAQPIPFFDGKEDINFLKTFFENDFKLHGIDQEFVYSFPYLYDELYFKNKKTKALKKLRIDYKYFFKNAYNKDENNYRYNIYEDILNNDTLKKFISNIRPLNNSSKFILKEIHQSLAIYNANRKRDNGHLRRVHLMRLNIENILSEHGTQAKYILKLGRIHLGKERQLNAYDVGNFIAEFAKQNNLKATHIGFLRGYYVNEGELKFYGTKKEKHQFLFNELAQKDSWTLINLKALKKEIIINEKPLFNNYTEQLVRSYLDNYDLLLIPPLDEKQTPILK